MVKGVGRDGGRGARGGGAGGSGRAKLGMELQIVRGYICDSDLFVGFFFLSVSVSACMCMDVCVCMCICVQDIPIHGHSFPIANLVFFFLCSGRPLQDNSYKIKTVVISLMSVFSVALVIIVAYFGYRMCTRPRNPSMESLHAPESPPVDPEFDMDDLKLCNIISKGRYAEVSLLS